MTLLTDKRTRELRKLHKAGDVAGIDRMLLAGAQIQWRFWLVQDKRDRLETVKYREACKAQRDAYREKEKIKRQREQLELKARARRERELQLLAKKRDQELVIKAVIQLITENKVTINHRFMKSIKDPDLKRKVIEATCLSKV